MSGRTGDGVSSDNGVLRSLLAVLVVFRQVPRECATIRTLAPAGVARSARLDLFIYDNSPTSCESGDLPDPRFWDVTYIHDPSNPGVSTGYRAAASFARGRGKRWLLLLDQDTSFPPDVLAQYVAAVGKHHDASVFSPILRAGKTVISPCAYRFLRGRPLTAVRPGFSSFDGISILNSGMWIAVDTYLAAGGHDARIPLDFSDHEFVERLKKVVPGFVVVDAVASHGLSARNSQTAAEAASRFAAYTRGAVRTSHSLTARLGAMALISARALMLALRYRRLRFLNAAFNALRDAR